MRWAGSRHGGSCRSRSPRLPKTHPQTADEHVGAALAPLPRGISAAALAGAGAVALFAAAHGGFFPSAWRWGAIAFAAAAGAAALLQERPAPPAGWRALLGLAVALGAWTALSAVWSLDPSLSLLEAQRNALYVAAIGALLLLAGRSAGAGLAAGVVVGAAGICLAALLGRAVFEPEWDTFEGTLLVGTIGYANALGALAAIGGVTAAVAAVRARGRLGLAAAATLLVFVPALVLTNSRGAWAAGLGGAAFAAVLALGRRREAVAVLAAAFVALALLLALPLSHHGGLGDRPEFWSAARAAIADRPGLGAGSGGFAQVWARAAPTGHPARDAHSLYLETLVELGPVGLALLLALLAVPFAVGLRAARPPAAALGGYAVFCLHAGVDWDWEMPAVTLAGLALGIAALSLSTPNTAPASPPTRSPASGSSPPGRSRAPRS